MPAIHPARWAELSPHLDELLTLPPLDRARRLDELAANDPRTASDLRELLASREGASRVAFLGGVADQALLPAQVQAGEALGPWTLVEAIGEGGMGSVWRARRSDGRYEGEAAIKLLKTGLVGASAHERFRREGAILARLRHPGIAQLLDAGVTACGQPYLVLDLVEGHAVDVWCQVHATSLRQRVQLFLQVVTSVAAAHAQLVIHRDLKPANILVDASGRARLLDFGIARLIDAEVAPALTREGGLALTPQYAAPEQWNGGALTVAVDVYQLGVVLYSLLCGRHPSGLPTDAPTLDYMRAALDGRIVRAASVNPALRGDLDNILAKALASQQQDRYGSAEALAADLSAWLEHRPVAARAASAWYVAAKFARRNRAAVGSATVAFVAVIAGSGLALAQAHRADRERALAQTELGHAAATGRLFELLITASGKAPMSASELLDRAAEQVRNEPSLSTETRARLLQTLGASQSNAGQPAQALALLREAHAVAAPLKDAALLANIDCVAAGIVANTESAAAGVKAFDEAIAALRATNVVDAMAESGCLSARIGLHANMGQPQRMYDDAHRALQLLAGEPTQPATMLRDLRMARGEAAMRLGRAAEGLQDIDAVIADADKAGLLRTARGAIWLGNHAQSLFRAGLMLDSERVARRGAAVAAGLGEDGIVLALNQVHLARALLEMGRTAEALPVAMQAVAITRALPDRRWAGSAALVAASASCRSGDLLRCGDLLASAEDHLSAVLPADHPLRTQALAERGVLAGLRGDAALARALLRQAVLAYDTGSQASVTAVNARIELVALERLAGDSTSAGKLADGALERARALTSGLPHSQWVGRAMLAQAQLRQAAGDPQAGAGASMAWQHLQATLGERAPAALQARALAEAMGSLR